MAPEMLFNRRKQKSQMKKYGLAVDYWSLGCVAFELVSDEADVRAIYFIVVPELTSPLYQCLFDSEEELRNYQSWHETEHPTSYLSFAGLSDNAESLVSGVRIVSCLFILRSDCPPSSCTSILSKDIALTTSVSTPTFKMTPGLSSNFPASFSSSFPQPLRPSEFDYAVSHPRRMFSVSKPSPALTSRRRTPTRGLRA